ncbi:MAG TPA: hypothetical protein VFK46_02860 [Candidatus Macondimonas sp.]|nr:hypothetical protein [Candidatus Macondimonas sp.]
MDGVINLAQAMQIEYDARWFDVARRLRILLQPDSWAPRVKPGNAIRRLLQIFSALPPEPASHNLRWGGFRSFIS